MQTYKELINVTFEMTSFLWPCPFWTFLSQWGFGGAVVRASSFHLWDRGFDSRYGRMTLLWKESFNALPKVVRFLRVLRFSPTGNVDRVGWDEPHTDPSTVAVLRDQTWVIRWLPEAPLENLRLDQVWAAFFVIDLSPFEWNFDLDKSGQKFHHSLKEHHKISNIPKFRCEML
jgi:hypothetical protein